MLKLLFKIVLKLLFKINFVTFSIYTGLASNTSLKEGILWNVANDGPVPEGFTIYTTDSGLTVLRRKRQRNLNKLGIGGFVVRQRHTTAKAQADDEKEGDGTQGSGGILKKF